MKDKIMNSGFGIGNLVFIAAVILALPLRIYQYVGNVIEPVTGFFVKTDWSIYALYGILIVASLAIVALGFIKRKTLSYDLKAEKRIGFGVISGLVAASMIIDSFGCLETVKNLETAINADATSPEHTTYYVTIVQIVFAFLSALYFVILCIGSLTGKTAAAEFKLVSLFPVFWAMLRMVARFMRTISYVRVSELMFEMLMLMFLIMFFMAFAQCNSKVNDSDCQWKIAAYGLPAALLALVCFVPRAILAISGNADDIYTQSTLEFSDLAVALFIVATVLTRVTLNTPETTEETAIKTEE